MLGAREGPGIALVELVLTVLPTVVVVAVVLALTAMLVVVVAVVVAAVAAVAAVVVVVVVAVVTSAGAVRGSTVQCATALASNLFSLPVSADFRALVAPAWKTLPVSVSASVPSAGCCKRLSSTAKGGCPLVSCIAA